MIWAPGGLSQASPLAVVAAVALVVAGWIALRSLFLRFGVSAGGPPLAAAMASLAFGADFASRPFQDIRVGVVVVVLLWLVAFLAGTRRLALDVDRGALGLGLVLFVLLAWVAVTTGLWDEAGCHAPLAFAASQGILPAEHPSYPGIPFPYHAAFDVLAGVFVVVGVRPIGAALDVATLFTALACLWCLFDVGAALGGRRAGLATMVFGLLHHGPLAAFGKASFQLPLELIAGFDDPGMAPPPPVSSLFQHPQGFAMSVAPAILLLAAGQRLGARVAGLVLLLLLAPVNVAAFALTFGGSALLCLRRREHLAWFAAGHVVVGVVAIWVSAFGSGSGSALAWGGFFSSVPRTLWGSLVFFPVVVLLGGLVWQHRRTLSPLGWGLVGVAASGFMIGNIIHYERSWDIVKFLSFASYSATLVVTGLVVAALQGAGPQRLARVAAAVLVAGSVVGVVWVLRFGPLNGSVFFRYDETPPAGLAWAAAPHVHPHLGPRDCVITRAIALANVGVRVGGVDPDRIGGFAVDKERTRAAFELWQRAVDGDDDAARALGCRFRFTQGAPPDSTVVSSFEYGGRTWTLSQLR
ncbi:MAG: hypothetical protein Q8O67_18155 [Deltaproteobacteria bacterium]|nr:hypothetical protein [Deltaproteobacteria bacterium]